MYKDILKELNRKFKLGLKFNHNSLECVFPNGSMLYLLGLDSKPEESEKALGQKYKLVIVDEAGSWKQDQEHLVHSILEPACMDLSGTICLIGSPVNHTRSYFFRLTYYKNGTTKYIGGWSRHKWSWQQNPHTRDPMKKRITELIHANYRVRETAAFKQMYLNEWVIDLGAKVYKYAEPLNQIKELPKDHKYFYTLGLDLGFNDATAIVISAYSHTDSTMYIAEVFKQSEMDITSVATQLHIFRSRYNPIYWVVDGASKQAVEELRNRHGFPLVAADKMGKSDIIEIMNADFIMGKIKLLPGAKLLADEYDQLVWDERSKRREEHPACPNHAADGALYSWRTCYHYAAEQLVKNPRRGSTEEVEAWWQSQVDKAAKAKKNEGGDFVSKDWGKEYGYH